MRACFAFTNIEAKDNGPATLSLLEEIGFWGTQAKDFLAQLGAVKAKTINLEINSPGGDVFAGLTIYNALVAWAAKEGAGRKVVSNVLGVAASAASVVMLAGSERVMPKNSFVMVHAPWSFAMGNAEELRESAAVLDKIGSSFVATYAARTGQTEAKVKELLSKDTWLTADEAKALGFATSVTEEIEATAKFDMERADLPEAVKAIFAKKVAPKAKAEDPSNPNPNLETEVPAGDVAATINKLAIAAKLDAYGATFAVQCATVDQAKLRIAAAKEIVTLCSITKHDDQAKAFIVGNKTPDEVRAALQKTMAEEADKSEIETKRKAQADGSNPHSAKDYDPQKGWDAHRAQVEKNLNKTKSAKK